MTMTMRFWAGLLLPAGLAAASLAGALDSMDSEVRQRAKEAIDSISELRRLRDEARKQSAPR